jgi:hypothetical protein
LTSAIASSTFVLLFSLSAVSKKNFEKLIKTSAYHAIDDSLSMFPHMNDKVSITLVYLTPTLRCFQLLVTLWKLKAAFPRAG